jgi:RimJ/RimL family protein N-acetyltransferase
MREAVRLLTRWVIEEQGFARVEIRVATANVASQRVAEGAGYTREGILRSAGFVHDGRVDLIVYSFIAGDHGGTSAGGVTVSGSSGEATTR